MDDESITRLALAAQRGDERAAAAFIRATAPQLRRILRQLGDSEHVDDLLQETYLRAFGALPRYAARSPARLWLLAIGRRVAADHIRTAQRRPRTSGVDKPEMWDRLRHHSSPGGRVELQQMIASLEPDQREAFVLTRVIGLSYAEAAQVCGYAVGTIRSRVFRARAKLIDAFKYGTDEGDADTGTGTSGRSR